MSKSEENPKSECEKFRRPGTFVIIPSFLIRISSLFRHSSFGFRHYFVIPHSDFVIISTFLIRVSSLLIPVTESH